MVQRIVPASAFDKTSLQCLKVGGDQKASAHVLAIPAPLQSHMIALLRFTHQLIQKGITVSFVCYEDSIPRLTYSANDTSEEEPSLDFQFVTLKRPCLDHKNGEHVTREVLESIMFKEAFKPLMEKLTRDDSAGMAGPTCIISDAFMPWTLDLADKLQIPRYTLIPAGLAYARLLKGCRDFLDLGQFQISETDGKLVEFDWSICLSGLPPLRYHELNNGFRQNPAHFREIAEAMIKSAGILVNSFFELEEKVVEGFRCPGNPADDHMQVPKIYPIGPLFSRTILTGSISVDGLEDSGIKCLLWLDSQPSSSVLYIAFGSMFRLRPEQINELAHGLEASNQRFLWVIPQSRDSSGAKTLSVTETLPAGFQERVGERGCIVTCWAPQLQILAHSSTGAFFTHTGWNSALESLIFGVPMICWPQGAEQHLNCRYFVDEMKVAEKLQTGRENILRRSEVERAVRLLMVEPEGTKMRSKVEELKRKAIAALAEGGSQSRFFQEFLDDILHQKMSCESTVEKLSAQDVQLIATIAQEI